MGNVDKGEMNVTITAPDAGRLGYGVQASGTCLITDLTTLS